MKDIKKLVKLINRKNILVCNIKSSFITHDKIIESAKEYRHLFSLSYLDRGKSGDPEMTRVSLTSSGLNFFFHVIDEEMKESWQ